MADMILLCGNPNAGKSTLFNRLARAHAHVGNYHGVTVDALEKQTEIGGKRVTLVDLPGIYSAPGRSLEEKFACKYIEDHAEAALLFVTECGRLTNFLPLMAALTKNSRRCALVLTKRRAFVRNGGEVDAARLSATLGIPVCFAEEKSLKTFLAAMLSAPPASVKEGDLSHALRPARGGLSRADKLLLNGFIGLPLFCILLLLAFLLTFAKGFPGDLMKEGIEWLFTDFLGGMSEGIPSEIVRNLVRDGILRSLGSVLCFLPQIALLHLFLILLEESGLLSRLAILTDGFFSKIGLSGRAVFSILMGFGCTAAAVTTTRGLDDKAMQKRVILCLPYISCSAKLPVYLTLSASFFSDPFAAVILLYLLGVALAVLVALFLKKRTPPFLSELAPLQLPRPLFVLKSLLFQIKQFIIKVATVILAFFLLSWLLSSFNFSFELCDAKESMLAKICGGLKWLFAPIGMGDWRIAYAAISGLVAKENVAGAIAMLFGSFPYSGASAFAFAVFILACSPCVSAIAATAREVGKGRAILYAAVQTVTALLLSYAVYFSLIGGAVYIALALVPLIGGLLIGKNREKVSRAGKKFAQRFHRRNVRTGVDGSSRSLEAQGRARQRQKGGRKCSPSPGR